MGLAICILFGVLVSWLTVTIMPKWRPDKILYSLLLGFVAGFAGCYAGKELGYADFEMFNLVSLGIAIVLAIAAQAVAWMINIFGWQSNIRRAGITILDNHEKAIAEHT